MNLVFNKYSLFSIVFIIGIACILYGITSQIYMTKSLPPTTLPSITHSEKTSEIKLGSNFLTENHYSLQSINNTKIEPILKFTRIISINVLHQDNDQFINILKNDIIESGGIITSDNDRKIYAILPGQYIERIELLLRQNNDQINPYYKEWAMQISNNPAQIMDINDQPTRIRIITNPKYSTNNLDRKNIINFFIFFFGVAIIVCTVAIIMKSGNRT